MTNRLIAGAILAVGAVAALAYANGTLNHFFVYGSASDSFWFAGLIWHMDLRMTNPPSIDSGSYYATHFSPFLYLPGLPSHLLPGDPITYFAVVTGVLHGMASAVFAGTIALAGHRAGLRAPSAALACLAAGAIVILLPAQFRFLQLPHFEIAIPALLIAFLAALADGRDRTASWIFVALLAVREDAGLHAAMFLLAWSAAIRFTSGMLDRRLLGYALRGVLWSAAAFVLGPLIAGGKQDIVRGLYLGDPLFAHMTPELIAARVLWFATQRTDLWCPLAAIAVAAAWRRDAHLAAGVAAVIPWIGLNVGFGNHPSNAELAFYYAFPLLIAFAWPTLRLLMEPGAPGALRRLGTLQVAVLLLGFAPAIGREGPSWSSRFAEAAIFDLEGLRQRPHYLEFAAAIDRHRATLGNFVATYDVIGLAPETMPRRAWAEGVARTDVARIARIDSILLFERPGGCTAAAALLNTMTMRDAFDVAGTRVLILTRRPVADFDPWGPMLIERSPSVQPCTRPAR